jgi:regulator of RNase E activity RraB
MTDKEKAALEAMKMVAEMIESGEMPMDKGFNLVWFAISRAVGEKAVDNMYAKFMRLTLAEMRKGVVNK